MDAFSLSLAYGTLNMKELDQKTLALIVGIYHFVMPLLGMFIGTLILKVLMIRPDWIVFMVLFFIGCQMIIESLKEQEQIKKMSKTEMLLFGLAVSIDSFSVGIGIKSMTNHYFLCAVLFSVTSFFFTALGLHCGKKVHQILGKISTMIGGTILIVLGIIYLI